MKATVASFVALFCLVCAGRAQQGRGTIFGTVTDSTGAAVNGAKVTILNADTNTAINTEPTAKATTLPRL